MRSCAILILRADQPDRGRWGVSRRIRQVAPAERFPPSIQPHASATRPQPAQSMEGSCRDGSRARRGSRHTPETSGQGRRDRRSSGRCRRDRSSSGLKGKKHGHGHQRCGQMIGPADGAIKMGARDVGVEASIDRGRGQIAAAKESPSPSASGSVPVPRASVARRAVRRSQIHRPIALTRTLRTCAAGSIGVMPVRFSTTETPPDPCRHRPNCDAEQLM